MLAPSSNLKESVLTTKNFTEDCVGLDGSSERELMCTPRRNLNPRQSEHRIRAVSRKLFPSHHSVNNEDLLTRTRIVNEREAKETEKSRIRDLESRMRELEIKTAHIKECKQSSTDNNVQGERKVLVSLFTDKVYTMDF